VNDVDEEMLVAGYFQKVSSPAALANLEHSYSCLLAREACKVWAKAWQHR
jgi:hypothetical protein